MNKEKLFEENMRLVPYVTTNVLKIPLSEFDFEEILQEGYIGLWKAVQTYLEDTSKFSTYACYCIKNEIVNYLNKPRRVAYRGRFMSGVSLDNLIYDDDTKSYQTEATEGQNDKELYIAIKDILNSLDKDDIMTKVLMLKIDGYTQLEICKKLNVSLPTIRKYLKEMRDYIKYQLGQEG